jgi:hypothetical protein
VPHDDPLFEKKVKISLLKKRTPPNDGQIADQRADKDQRPDGQVDGADGQEGLIVEEEGLTLDLRSKFGVISKKND